ncbi:MAG: hypothetical protein KKH88_04485 [Nanoarchaeota archaeon]|nr:hypothetical protein [Nanoarchaeota archaeon]
MIKIDEMKKIFSMVMKQDGSIKQYMEHKRMVNLELQAVYRAINRIYGC